MNILFKINYYIFKKYKYLNNNKNKTQKNFFMFKVKKKIFKIYYDLDIFNLKNDFKMSKSSNSSFIQISFLEKEKIT